MKKNEMGREESVECKKCGKKFTLALLKDEAEGMILMGYCPSCQKMQEVKILT